jgi:hypothetical protein
MPESAQDFRPWDLVCWRRKVVCMFATYAVTIDASYHEVSGRLTHLLNWGVMHGVSEVAYEGGLETSLRVGPVGAVRGLSKLVRVRTLDPVRLHDRTLIALRWEATGVTGELFPVLDAELVLTSVGEDRSRLELTGSYRPPLGHLGAVLDKVVMERVAEATIRSLLERMAEVLAVPEPSSTPDLGIQLRGFQIVNPEES